jgi:hypothetical protein
MIAPHEVAAHACRHLAFLRATDSVVGGIADAHSGLWRLIAEFRPDVAGAFRMSSVAA